VLLQSCEHRLRSYRPITCWLLISVFTKDQQTQSFLIDAIRLKHNLAAALNLVTKAVQIVKVVEQASLAAKLWREFGCQTLNIVLVQKAVETTSCFSTVLIEQDYRIRPLTPMQMQILALGQKDLLSRTISLVSLHLDSESETNALGRLVAKSQDLSKNCFAAPDLVASLAPKGTLRGKLQRWRDKVAQSWDEGVQFVLEDNLLNHLLVQSESAPALNSLWLIRTCQAFYERALSAAYAPLYFQHFINEISLIFCSMQKQVAPIVAPNVLNAKSQSFVPTKVPQMGVREMSPRNVNNSQVLQKSLSSKIASPTPNMMRFESMSGSFQSSAQSSSTSVFSPEVATHKYSA